MVDTDIITSIAASLIVIIDAETFKTDVIVSTSKVIMFFMSL
jgi:hypothetical protein